MKQLLLAGIAWIAAVASAVGPAWHPREVRPLYGGADAIESRSLASGADPVESPVVYHDRNPFRGSRWFVDPRSSARKQIDLWKSAHPDWAAELEKIADRSQADWFLDPLPDIRSKVDARVTLATDAGALPVLVAYYIPRRDCGGYSSGGAASADGYRAWIREFAAGIGRRRAAVILEPDALPDVDTAGCLSPEEQQTRLSLLDDAVRVLESRRRTAVYIDAGNATWLPAQRAADLLHQAGAARADGFALNVSNFETTADTMQYGAAIAHLIGDKHFIVDTSRNGRGPADNDQWCNPPGRGLGEPPTTKTADLLCDAYLWVKSPGESDGAGPDCYDGPPAGQWWPEYALGLAQRAAVAAPPGYPDNDQNRKYR